MAKINLKQGEAKTLTLTVTQDGAAVNLTDCALFLGVKKKKSDTAYTFSKEDAAFDKAQVVLGIVSVFLTGTDTNQPPGIYLGELKITFPGAPPATVEKSADLNLEIEQAITA